jgi:acyl carrier protein
MKSKDEIFSQVRETMVSMFELESDSIKLDSHLFKDLDLDSIDAIDMAVKMQDLTGQRVEESALQGLQTVGDIVDLAHNMMDLH